MPIEQVTGRRALYKVDGTRWEPVDLACVRENEVEEVVRTKLVRSPDTAAVCVAESISHAVLTIMGFTVAEERSVSVSSEFAESITAAFGWRDSVRSCLHWGTVRLIDVFEGEVTRDHVNLLSDPSEVFRLYLADELLANPDRVKTNGEAKHGNTLLAPDRGGKFRLLPIDQSEAFDHPRGMCSPGHLEADEVRNRHFATGLPGMESVLVEGGRSLLDGAFLSVERQRDQILGAVTAPKDEWYEYAGTEPSILRSFLEHRLDRLEVLARREHWRGIIDFAEGYHGHLF